MSDLVHFVRDFKEQVTVLRHEQSKDPDYIHPKYERVSHLDISLQYLKELDGSCPEVLAT